MNYLFSIIFFFFSFFVSFQQNPVNLKISNISVTYNDSITNGNPIEIPLMSNGKSQIVELFSDEEVRVLGKFHVSTHEKVRRSNLKKSAIDVEAEYVFYYKNETRKVPTKQIFYLTDDLQFKVHQTAYFKKGIKNYPIELDFTAILE
jgi:hypothetical protein